MNKFKLMLALLAAPAMVLTSCGDDTQQTEGSVKKVTVTCSTKTLGVGDTVTAKANVSVDGGAQKTVKWSSDNSSVATVDENSGKITAKAVGSAKITATSTVDSSKSGSVTITVVNKGPHPSLIEEGYEYVDEWPTADIKKFAGIDTPTIDLSEGLYFLVNPGDEEEQYAPSIEICIEDTDDNYYDLMDAFDDAGWHYHYDSQYYCDCFIDPTKKVEVDIGEQFLNEDYTESVISYSVYRTEDIWLSAEDTEDTAWATELANVLDEMGLDLPFVKMGADYDFDDSDGVYIYDYSPDYEKLDGYGTALKGAGFTEKGSESEGFYYTKTIDAYSEFVVYYGFDSDGNYIGANVSLIELSAFPSEAVSAYLTRNGSVTELPAFVGSEDVKFTFDDYTEEGEEFVDINLYNATETECLNYVALLKSNEFVEIQSDGTEEGYVSALLQKGKLCVEAVMSYWRAMTDEELDEYFNQDVEQMTDEEYDEFYENYMIYMFYGYVPVLEDEMQSAWLTLSIDSSAKELPGLYYNGNGLKVKPDNDVTVEVEIYKLGDSVVLSYVSSDTTIATVSDAGVVHGVAEGTCKITVSTNVSGVDYSVEVPVEVRNVTDYVKTITPTEIGTKGAGYAKTNGDHVITVGEGSATIYTNDVCNNKDDIQLKKGTGTLSTKTPFVGEITSIVLPTNALNVYIGSNQAAQELIAPVACDGGYEYTAPAGSLYFTITNTTTAAVAITSIIVNYVA